MIKIMFVCHGNICRSPMAEFIFKHLILQNRTENKFFVASSATSTEEIWNGMGNPVYPPAREELAKYFSIQTRNGNVTADTEHQKEQKHHVYFLSDFLYFKSIDKCL